MRTEGKSSEFRNLSRGALGEFGMRVQSRSPCGSADGQVIKPVQRLLQTLDVALQQTGPASELLSKGQWHRILQMRAPNFHHVMEFLRLGSDCIVYILDRWNQRGFHSIRGRNVHRGRKQIGRATSELQSL